MELAIRLTFEYRGNDVSLRSARRLRKRTPPNVTGAELKRPCEAAGDWVELRDKEDQVLYRHRTSDLIPTHIEVRSGDPKQPFKRIQGQLDHGTFRVLIPAVDAARRFVLLQGRDEGDQEELGPTERISVDLDQIEYRQSTKGPD
jgi:hypothetical protein